jgi:rod shape-determining protein MreC
LGDLLRRFSYPLTYLLLGLLCAVSLASRRDPAPLGPGSRAVLDLTLPLQQMVTLPLREVQDLWRGYVALVGLRGENERLNGEVARLEEEVLQYREAIVSSERFQRLAGFRARRDVPMVPANVVAHDVSQWFQSIVIDQGSNSGIRPGMAVITDSGVVGVVAGTTPAASRVLLVIDPQSRVDVYVQRTRARGTLRGRSERACGFEYVLRDDDVAAGDLLLTSGLGDVYSKGLVVGEVTSVEKKPYGLFQIAEVQPAVDFRRLEEVFVILERQELPDPEEFASDHESLWQVPAEPPPSPPGAAAAAAADEAP